MTFTLSSSSTEQKATTAVIIADLDGDGDLDYVAGNTDNGAPVVQNDTYRNDGSMSFTRMSNLGLSTSFNDISAADVDNDGDIDFLLANSTNIYLYKNIGAFSYSAGYTYDYGVGAGTIKTALTDIDNDGDLDIVVGTTNSLTQAVHINDGHGNFTIAASTLPGSTHILAADFNSDGYSDLALVRTNLVTVMRGSGTGAFIPTFSESAGGNIFGLATGDIDGDGDIDIVKVTLGDNKLNPLLNNGEGTTFTAGTTTGTFTQPVSVALGDLDTDGDLDAIVGGAGGSQAYLNDGSGVFTPSGSALGAADATRNVAIGDLDGDGDLDYIAGNQGSFAGNVNRVYGNDQAATLPNTAPTAPSSLTAMKVSDNGTTATVRLSWGSGSDTQTATKMLQYQLRVGTGANANNIISGKTASPNWVSRVMPNGQSRTMLLKNIPCSKTFYWSAATVDTGFMSTESAESTFTVDSSCSVSNSQAASTTDTGGGLPAGWFRQSEKKTQLDEIINGTITVSAFTDIIRNGLHDASERSGFAGLSVTASGRTLDGTAMIVTQNLDHNGVTTFSLPPSDSRGYWILVASGSDILKGFEPTTATETGTSILKANGTHTLSFGFVPGNLIRYVPCMDIGPPSADPPSDTEASKLLVRLEDSFGRPILRGVSLTGSLATRKNFFLALQKTHCLPLETQGDKLAEALRKTLAGRLILPLIDLRIDLHNADATLLYSLLSLGIHAERDTLSGPAADLSSPITRREALQSIADTLNVSKDTVTLTGTLLPADLEPDDPLVPAYLTLKDLGILPENYHKTLGPSQGITPSEASLLLARAAFRGGKITLLPRSLDRGSRDMLKSAAKTPTFLAQIPSLTVPSCLTTTESRAKDFSFTDILPGHPLSADITHLLTRGTQNADDRLLWLLTGTSRPTEFGVGKGTSTLNLEEPPSILETIRTLLVLNCLPPDTPSDAKNKVYAGSLSSKIPRDMISGLPRDSSFASRVLFKAQDHQRTFDLSLFTAAPELLRKEERPPASALTLSEASSLLASALLRMAVLQEVITPQDAEGQASPLRLAIAEDLLGRSIDWENEYVLAITPFTREMLLRFLSTVVLHRTVLTTAASTPPISLGEYWRERVR